MGGVITFTINGTEYQAEEGMTWKEWVYSEYNVIGFYLDNLDNYIDAGNWFAAAQARILEGVWFVCYSDGLRVEATDNIIKNYSYVINHL